MRASRLILSILTLSLASGAESQDDRPAPPAEERLASRIDYLVAKAARPAWSQQGDWIAFDRRGSDGFQDLYIGKPDNSFDRCLTCDIPQFNKRHSGNASWHPSGRFIVFQTEVPFRHDGNPYPFLAIPGRNRGSGIWVISPEGGSLFQLVGQQQGAFPVHGPRFSFEGDQMAWSERVASSGMWGDWVMRAGSFGSGSSPRVSRVGTYEPGAQKAFYEVASFTSDDRGLFFAGNLIEGQPVDGIDLYTMKLDTEHVQQLTKGLDRWDRFPAIAPNGQVTAWSSNETLRMPERPLSRDDRTAVVQLDLWLGAVDGSWTRRLTGFNDALSEEYVGPVMVGPSTWSPAGDQILTTVTPLDDPEHSDLFLITLIDNYGGTALQGQ